LFSRLLTFLFENEQQLPYGDFHTMILYWHWMATILTATDKTGKLPAT